MTTKIPPGPPIRFAVRAKPSPPWPFSPLLELPGGTLHNYGGGKILSGQKFVYVVGLSPHHFVAVEKAPGVGPVQPVKGSVNGIVISRLTPRPISGSVPRMVIAIAIRCAVTGSALAGGDENGV